jgi:adenylate kinase family enzyme
VKIAVIGYSGSGKSTLSAKLAEEQGVQLLHLDTVYWLPGWEHRTREEMRLLVGEYLDAHGHWVIDGNYSKILFDRRMSEADHIILLQFSRLACLLRAWKRYRTYRGKSRSSMTEGCPEKLDGEFVRWVLWNGRKKEYRDLFRSVQTDYPQKVSVIRNQRQLDRFEAGWKYA